MKIGIYGFQNKVKPEKWYIGRSIDIDKRWNAYRLLRCKSQRKWYNALKKYGYDGFNAFILEECDETLLSEKERYWVLEKNSVKLGYNCKDGGEGGGKHSNETKELLRKLMIGKKWTDVRRKKYSGYKMTEETKKKISDSLNGNDNRLGIVHDEETKQKISNSLKGRVFTDEHRRKISEKSTWKGKVSQQSRIKASEKLKNRPRPDSVKSKISNSKKGTTRKYLPDGSFIMVKILE